MFIWHLNVKKINNSDLDLIELEEFVKEREKIVSKKDKKNKVLNKKSYGILNITTSEALFVKYIERSVAKYIPLLGLSSYNVKVSRSSYEDSKEPKTGFLIDVLYPYKSAELYWTKLAFRIYKAKKFKKLEQAIVHELCHIPIERLKKLAMKRYLTKKNICDATETLVDHFAWVVFRLINKK